MKNKTVEESNLKELNHFPNLMEAIMEYLDKYWDIEAKPKGYDEYLKTYQEYDTEDMEYEFSGPLDTSAACDPFPYRISKSSVAYGDTEQGRTPTYALLGAVFAYGLNIGAQRQKMNEEDMWAVKSARDVLSYVVEGKITVEELMARAERAIENIDFKYPALMEK